MFIPISQPSISQKEIDFVSDAVRSSWISSLGKYIDTFESEFARFCGSRYACCVSNGTVAIHLSLIANGIGKGDEVIIPDLSFVATVNAVIHAGATPIIVDIDPFNLCIAPEEIERAITPRTKAVIPVHLYGHPADMRRIMEICNRNNLIVIEDAAEAHGSSAYGKRVGSWGNCGTFSFYGNKNITTGEGGMITTDDEALLLRLKYLRDHAMSKEKRYWHTEVGYNYRMTNIQAALGCAQLERVEELLEKRKTIFGWYSRSLSNIPGVSLNRTNDWAENTYWLVCMEYDRWQNEEERNAFMSNLKSAGIDSRPYFYPMSDMPYLSPANTPVTHRVFKRGINLPTYFDLTEEQADKVCEIILKNLHVSRVAATI